MSQVPRIELLWWEGCPSAERALAQLHDVLAEFELGDAEIHVREITTEAEAARAGFRGSPTIQVGGVDVDRSTASEAESVNPLTCRVYHRRDGRISPVPDPEDLRDALRAGLAAAEAVRT